VQTKSAGGGGDCRRTNKEGGSEGEREEGIRDLLRKKPHKFFKISDKHLVRQSWLNGLKEGGRSRGERFGGEGVEEDNCHKEGEFHFTTWMGRARKGRRGRGEGSEKVTRSWGPANILREVGNSESRKS